MRSPIDLAKRLPNKVKRFRALRGKVYRADQWEKALPTEALQGVYDQQGWSGRDGQWRQRSVDRLIVHIHGLLETQETVSMLDVACFTGDYFGRLIETDGSLVERLHYTGVDVTPKYLETAAKRWGDHQNASFELASALELPFEGGSFDIVFNSGMLIHVPDPAAPIRECARVAEHSLLIETTVKSGQAADFVETNQSGLEFIDRTYRDGYIRSLVAEVATITAEHPVPYRTFTSLLFEAAPLRT